jgi:hypothetical protein
MSIDAKLWEVKEAQEMLLDLAGRYFLTKTLLLASYARVHNTISIAITNVNHDTTPLGNITVQKHNGILGLAPPFELADWGCMQFLTQLRGGTYGIHRINVMPDTVNIRNNRNFSCKENRSDTAKILREYLPTLGTIRVEPC